jgi:hypothetical protein
MHIWYKETRTPGKGIFKACIRYSIGEKKSFPISNTVGKAELVSDDIQRSIISTVGKTDYD